ncbi:MAG: FkbM family methyltransferase [Promethearchaeota archaeon]
MNKSILFKKRALNLILELIPRYYKIYNFFRRYIDMYNGDNNDNMHLNGEIRFLRNNLKDNDVIFDVGANIGEWTKQALNFKKKIYLHCFEPSIVSFGQLINNNFPSNVICNNFGLSSIKEEKLLYSTEKGSTLSSLYKRKWFKDRINIDSELKNELIRLDTLDNYCNLQNIEHINFLKIDVEGHEYEVLKGGKKMFENSQVDIIQFEYGGCYIDAHIFLKDIFDLFEGLNYNFYKIFPKYINYIKSYDFRFENFQYQNWLIIRKDYNFIP